MVHRGRTSLKLLSFCQECMALTSSGQNYENCIKAYLKLEVD